MKITNNSILCFLMETKTELIVKKGRESKKKACLDKQAVIKMK